MKKWTIAAIMYLIAVIGGYQVYAQFIQKDDTTPHSESHESAQHGDSGSGIHEHGDSHQSNDVNAKVNYNNSVLTINLTDKDGNPVDNLEVNHEKIMHLIVVDVGLEKYYHLHPEKTGEGTFKIKQPLENGSYKAFVDIKPEGLNYEVRPAAVFAGAAGSSIQAHNLTPDASLEKTVDGEKVQMKMSGQKSSEPVTLSFSLDKTKLEPYLGAAGHVVILDEEGEKYLHVHPLKENEPVFQTEFDRPGIYKIWAEFKQNGKVRVFPFVVEIK